MRLRDRIARLEARTDEQLYIPKRPLPEWLQASWESQGYVFDEAGRWISSPPDEEVNASQKTPDEKEQ